jgi:hypothetical protein
MNRVEQRKQRLMQDLRENLKTAYGTDLGPDLGSWPAQLRKPIEEASEEPENRMRRTMKDIAEALHLSWSDEFPTDHPYEAELDGQIFNGNKRVAVVELEDKNNKQIRAALLDLLTHPHRNKMLVLGGAAACDPPKAAAHIRKVLGLLSALVGESRVGVFTEAELKQEPGILGRFLELP